MRGCACVSDARLGRVSHAMHLKQDEVQQVLSKDTCIHIDYPSTVHGIKVPDTNVILK